MAAKFEKLLIKKQDRPDGQFKDEFTAQYNPERYAIEKAATWTEQQVRGRPGKLQYGGEARKSITFEFFFDTYAVDKDVRVEYVRKLGALIEPTVETSGGRKYPPVLLLSWGGFTFKCVLEKLSQNFTLFNQGGVPVRAIVTATFKQFSTPEEEARSNPVGDPTKTYLVREGDTLNRIAASEYSDPALWRIIADANAIDNPLLLAPGTRLVVPALV
jgi:hypothetical protein